jgi:hypothetical protein
MWFLDNLTIINHGFLSTIQGMIKKTYSKNDLYFYNLTLANENLLLKKLS